MGIANRKIMIKPNKKRRKAALFGDRSESPISKGSNYLVF
jgi:hypothetical protein